MTKNVDNIYLVENPFSNIFGSNGTKILLYTSNKIVGNFPTIPRALTQA
jgi:hypothetical protein